MKSRAAQLQIEQPRKKRPSGLSSLLKKTSDRVKSIAFSGAGEYSFYDEYEEYSRRTNGSSLATRAAGQESVSYMKHSIMVECGLQPFHSLLDFCCGMDTMATYSVPYLGEGLYLGMEVSETALENTRRALLSVGVKENNATWLLESDSDFPLLGDQSVDMISAFTVFSHMQAEDVVRFLKGLRRVLRPDGRLIASFLLVEESDFAKSLLLSPQSNNEVMPCRVTSRSFVETVAKAVGLQVETWFEHDKEAFEVGPGGEFAQFGQSICVMRS